MSYGHQKVVLCSKQCVSTVGKRKWRGNISNKKVFYICKTSSISLLSISGLSISVLFHFWTFHFWTFPFLDFPFLDSLKNRPLIVHFWTFHFWTQNFHFSLSAYTELVEFCSQDVMAVTNVVLSQFSSGRQVSRSQKPRIQ